VPLHDEARRFYARYQFEPAPTDALQLMLLTKDAKTSVAAPQGEEDAEQRRRAVIDAMAETGAD
jgi:hypothetical protein